MPATEARANPLREGFRVTQKIMTAPNAPSTAAKRKGPQWSSPWVIGFVLIAVLYLTGLLDKGFFYAERRYYAPWSLGDNALTGAWEGAVVVGSAQRRVFLTIALHTKSRFSRTTRRNNSVSSTSLWIVDGEVQLLGTLTVCPGAAQGREGEVERFELSGHANGNASKVELSPAAVDRGSRFGFESLSGAWRGRQLPASLVYTSAPARSRTASVTFRKLEASPSAVQC